MPLDDMTKLSVVVDFDGCASTDEACKRLINHVGNLVTTNPCIKTVDVSIGSTRGTSFMNDFHAAYLNSNQGQWPYFSCSILWESLVIPLRDSEALKGIKVSFDNLLLGDILSDLEIGTSFDLMYQNKQSYKYWSRGKFSFSISGQQLSGLEMRHINVVPMLNGGIEYFSDAPYVNDEYKILMIYMQMHRKAMLNPDKNFILDFYDDRSDILEKIIGFYSENRALMPSHCYLRVNQLRVAGYPESSPLLKLEKEKRVIKGEGVLNACFKEDVRLINARHNRCLGYSPASPEQSEVCELLKKCVLLTHKDRLEKMSALSKEEAPVPSRESASEAVIVSKTGMYKRSSSNKENEECADQQSKKAKFASVSS